MEAPTSISMYNLRGPSPVVWAMRTRLVAPPPAPSDSLPPPPPPPLPFPIAPPPPEKRRRGRPRKYDRLPPPPGFAPSPSIRTSPPPRPPPPVLGQLGGLQPHVLTFKAGENIASRIIMFSQTNERAICILSAHGSVQEATLLQSSGVTLTHKGHFEIIRLSGSIFTCDNRCLSLTFASPDGTVIGGIVAGPLIAAMTVQAIVGSFRNDEDGPNKKPKIILPCTSSQVTTDNANTPSSGRPNQDSSPSTNPDLAPCTTMEQTESSHIDIKPSNVVA